MSAWVQRLILDMWPCTKTFILYSVVATSEMPKSTKQATTTIDPTTSKKISMKIQTTEDVTTPRVTSNTVTPANQGYRSLDVNLYTIKGSQIGAFDQKAIVLHFAIWKTKNCFQLEQKNYLHLLWVTLGDYTVTNAKLGKEFILYLAENRISRKQMWCAADNHNYICHICANGF